MSTKKRSVSEKQPDTVPVPVDIEARFLDVQNALDELENAVNHAAEDDQCPVVLQVYVDDEPKYVSLANWRRGFDASLRWVEPDKRIGIVVDLFPR